MRWFRYISSTGSFYDDKFKPGVTIMREEMADRVLDGFDESEGEMGEMVLTPRWIFTGAYRPWYAVRILIDLPIPFLRRDAEEDYGRWILPKQPVRMFLLINMATVFDRHVWSISCGTQQSSTPNPNRYLNPKFVRGTPEWLAWRASKAQGD